MPFDGLDVWCERDVFARFASLYSSLVELSVTEVSHVTHQGSLEWKLGVRGVGRGSEVGREADGNMGLGSWGRLKDVLGPSHQDGKSE